MVAVHSDVYLVEQGAQQLFAVLVGGGRRGPHLVEVLAEGGDGGALAVGERDGAGLLPRGRPGAAARLSPWSPGRGPRAGSPGRLPGSGVRLSVRRSGLVRLGGGAG